MDCLNTKIKSAVGSQFPKLGVLELNADANNLSVFYFVFDGTATMTTTNGHFTNSAGISDYGTSMNKTGSSGYIYITAGSILSVNAYKVNRIYLTPQGSASACTTDTMQLSQCINITLIQIKGNTGGNIAYLSNLSALTDLDIQDTSVTGDLSSLLPNKNTLHTIKLPNSVVYSADTLQEFTTAGCTVVGGTLLE